MFVTKQKNEKQVAGADFGGPLLICLLNFTPKERSSLHSLHSKALQDIERCIDVRLKLIKLFDLQSDIDTLSDRESNYRGHSNPVYRWVEWANIS